MEVNGLVERRRDDPDGRLVRVYLTEQGRKIQGPIQQEIDRIATAAVAGLSDRSRHELTRALETVRDNLRSVKP
jgi:MarR family transcriptional regulator, organic hydroperoxide resistance regulator